MQHVSEKYCRMVQITTRLSSLKDFFPSNAILVRGGSKGVINFPWIFFFLCNAEFSPCRALLKYIQALIHLACSRVFSVTPWVIVYRFYRERWLGQSDLFWKIMLDWLRTMEYHVSKASTVSIITAFTHHQLLTDIFFNLFSTKNDIKTQNAAIWRFLR